MKWNIFNSRLKPIDPELLRRVTAMNDDFWFITTHDQRYIIQSISASYETREEMIERWFKYWKEKVKRLLKL